MWTATGCRGKRVELLALNHVDKFVNRFWNTRGAVDEKGWFKKIKINRTHTNNKTKKKSTTGRYYKDRVEEGGGVKSLSKAAETAIFLNEYYYYRSLLL